ncbi:hypothetical protein [Leptothoe spongobia]|uniref:Uncharacterized protein n=1 Tax=Leptothoe spongobia TAU-MAC 1115 TaxID=1967444 RepID=A0A947DD72_9CYAN|nr:hypothetical protein [Leptothoe spongobia]MBT9314523.1 hypothetical protein [Leptothoe spongobia TAU-MAC 1115]
MYAQENKATENKSRAVANAVAQKKSVVKQGFRFMDNRTEAVAQKKIQSTMNNYSMNKIVANNLPNSQIIMQRRKYLWSSNRWIHDNKPVAGNAPARSGDFDGQIFDDATQTYTRQILVKGERFLHETFVELSQGQNFQQYLATGGHTTRLTPIANTPHSAFVFSNLLTRANITKEPGLGQRSRENYERYANLESAWLNYLGQASQHSAAVFTTKISAWEGDQGPGHAFDPNKGVVQGIDLTGAIKITDGAHRAAYQIAKEALNILQANRGRWLDAQSILTTQNFQELLRVAARSKTLTVNVP